MKASNRLLANRPPAGHWVGELSSSALSTATAVCALAIVEREQSIHSETARDPVTLEMRPALRRFEPYISRGLDWLENHLNPDGGWGDTDLSSSNLSTTALGWAAFGAVPGAPEKYHACLERVERWLTQRAGGLNPEQLVPAIVRRYGKDRTFSAPILTMCALAGRLGPNPTAWRWVRPMPFELAACPHRWFSWLRLPVVSYALPALIAMGQARHYHRPTRNPITRFLRNLTRRPTLNLLVEIQPASGGFLEATPLTSFVVMSLAASGLAHHTFIEKSVGFLTHSARPDGPWPIDTNLATWVTTLAVNALGNFTPTGLDPVARDRIRAWLLAQQFRAEHPYTHAAPGGWAWTPLPGGLPDADDTAGALLALHHLGGIDDTVRQAAANGIRWLLDLQNRDGGIPTFCRGWGALPFDRSGADLTAHAVRAWLIWHDELDPNLTRRIDSALGKALAFLGRAQRDDGGWLPLWFGNQYAAGDENPTYGTARVILALADCVRRSSANVTELLRRGIDWMLAAQRADGSWGGGAGGPSSIEETALAVEALAAVCGLPHASNLDVSGSLPAAVGNGASWLIERVETGQWAQPSPIGFYFAKLWYYERLYPLIFTVGALRQMIGSPDHHRQD